MLQVKIGDRYLGRAGCLAYSDISAASSTDDDSHSVIYIIVIVGTIGIALIIILTAIVLRAYVSCRRHDDDERSPLGPPKVTTEWRVSVHTGTAGRHKQTFAGASPTVRSRPALHGRR